MDAQRLAALVRQGETLECEFKSDSRTPLSDGSIYEDIVAMANTNGGVLLIGVEDDGTVTSARPRHGRATVPLKLQAAIFGNTVPPVNTRVAVVDHPEGTVVAVEVDRYPTVCATKAGKCLRRATGPDGKPQTIPFYPHEQTSRRSDLGLTDTTAAMVAGTSWQDLDPLEFERVRQCIARLRGDRELLELSDEEVAKALRLVETTGASLVPNHAGLLLLGRREAIESALPTHEVRFQVIDAGGDVRVNDVFRGPLVWIVEELEARFSARNQELEVPVGLIRLPVPDYAPLAFREAVLNALLHRQYAELQAVYIQWYPDHMLITSPGGFPEGITTDNILTHEPKPRNLRLAEAFRRVGLIEQTGRGIDRIFEGQLRYGRPAPDYSRTDATGVRLVLRGGDASLAFAAFIYEQEKQQQPLRLDEMLVLNALLFERRIDSTRAARLIQKGLPEARSLLGGLVERGLLEGVGERKGRAYHLSAKLYRRFGGAAGYVRAHGIDPIRHEAMVLDFVKAHGRVTRRDVAGLCGVTGPQATHLLQRLRHKHPQLLLVGEKRGAHYVWDDTKGA